MPTSDDDIHLSGDEMADIMKDVREVTRGEERARIAARLRELADEEERDGDAAKTEGAKLGAVRCWARASALRDAADDIDGTKPWEGEG